MMKKTTGVTKRWEKTVFPKTAAEVATAASRTGTRTETCVCEPKAAVSSSWLTQRRRRRKAAESVRKLARRLEGRALLTLRAEDELNRHITETGNDCFCHVVPFFFICSAASCLFLLFKITQSMMTLV